MNVIAVVVTYNRKELLKECIEAIVKQSYKVDKIIIVDNNSTDGTEEYLNTNKILEIPEVILHKLEKNIGGAGGFYEGMKLSLNYNPDWVWIMDDDTIPTNNCLEELLESIENIDKKSKISFLASSIYGESKEFMNVPIVDTSDSGNGYPSFYKYLDKGLLKIEMATFVSLLINVEAIKKCGLPCKQYFIWGDDSEYTMRLTRNFGEAYMVGNSIAVHKRKLSKALKLNDEENENRIKMYYYMIRNTLINTNEYYGKKKLIKQILIDFKEILRILFKSNCKFRFKKIKIIIKGINAFVFKMYDYKQFKNRFDINAQS